MSTGCASGQKHTLGCLVSNQGEILGREVPLELGFECVPLCFLGLSSSQEQEHACEEWGSVGEHLRSQPAGCFLCPDEQ